MNKKELIELLSEYPDDLDILIHADHGQNYESLYAVEKEFYDKPNDEITHPQDLDKDVTYEKVIVLYS